MDKLKAMAVFVQIADRGSLTAAAAALGTSLPSVVRILAALEETLQVRLFNRTTRRIALTEEGHYYLSRCRRILAAVDESELALSQNPIDPHGSITLTAPLRFGEMHVAPSVTRYLNRYPRVQVHFLLLDRVVNLLDEGVDLALRIAPLHDSSLIARPVGQIRQVVCVSPALLARSGGAPSHPRQLAALPCVRFTGITPAPVWHFRDRGKRLSIPIKGPFSCNQAHASVDACIAGLGFGLLFDYQVMPWVERGDLEIVLANFEPEPLPLSIIFPHSRLMATRVRSLVDWLAGDLKRAMA